MANGNSLNPITAISNLKERFPNVDFSESIYTESRNKIKVRCKICDYVWYPRHTNMFRGISGCPNCCGQAKLDPIKAIESISLQHPNLDFSEAVFKGANYKIKIKCKICSYSWESMYHHTKKGRGCPKCAGVNRGLGNRLNPSEAISILVSKYPTLDFSESIYTRAKDKIKVTCKLCKHTWYIAWDDVYRKGGCSSCSASKGEKFLRGVLIKHNINFKEQHKFKDCRMKYVLPFDFYLPDFRTTVEVHGKQHYEPVEWFGGWDKFIIQKYRDFIKKDYCELNNINFIEIPYTIDIFNFEKSIIEKLKYSRILC